MKTAFPRYDYDDMVDDRLATPIAADANDYVYQWESSHDYNAADRLERIEASTETRGHGTTGNAKFYSEQLRQLLQTAPQRTM